MNEIIDQILTGYSAITNSGLLEEKDLQENHFEEKQVYLVDKQGNKIPFSDEKFNNFYNRLILIIGAGETGKTTMIQNITHLLQHKIPKIIHFTLSDILLENQSHKRLSLGYLNTIFEQQKNAMKSYLIANDMENMKSIFLQFADDNMKELVDHINQDTERQLELVENQYPDYHYRTIEEKKIRDLQLRSIKAVYKQCIDINKNNLMENKMLTESQRIAVQFCDLCPDLLLIFDDCASFFKDNYKEAVADMFYSGRHYGITMICTSHSDKDIPPNLRRAAYATIFTTAQSAISHFGTASNAYDRQTKERASLAIDTIFDKNNEFQTYKKLVFLRDEAEKIQYII